MKNNGFFASRCIRGKAVAASLKQLLADYQIFYSNLRGLHWNIKGHGFFVLHAKFEELYDDVSEKADELAERILMLRGGSREPVQRVPAVGPSEGGLGHLVLGRGGEAGAGELRPPDRRGAQAARAGFGGWRRGDRGPDERLPEGTGKAGLDAGGLLRVRLRKEVIRCGLSCRAGAFRKAPALFFVCAGQCFGIEPVTVLCIMICLYVFQNYKEKNRKRRENP